MRLRLAGFTVDQHPIDGKTKISRAWIRKQEEYQVVANKAVNETDSLVRLYKCDRGYYFK